MEIQIERVHGPMFELKFTEDHTKGETITMNKRSYRKFVRVQKEYAKMQKSMKELLDKIHV